jgi:hypothetical protein
MTDTTRIAVIGAAGWAGRQVPMIGLRSPIRVGSSLGHTASAKPLARSQTLSENFQTTSGAVIATGSPEVPAPSGSMRCSTG